MGHMTVFYLVVWCLNVPYHYINQVLIGFPPEGTHSSDANMRVWVGYINIYLFAWFPSWQEINERRSSFDRRNSFDRRGSEELGELPPMKKVDLEELELQQKQRRNSLQARRTSLADVIPGWPLLQKRKVAEKVHTPLFP
jgi:hypothetical protein